MIGDMISHNCKKKDSSNDKTLEKTESSDPAESHSSSHNESDVQSRPAKSHSNSKAISRSKISKIVECQKPVVIDDDIQQDQEKAQPDIKKDVLIKSTDTNVLELQINNSNTEQAKVNKEEDKSGEIPQNNENQSISVEEAISSQFKNKEISTHEDLNCKPAEVVEIDDQDEVIYIESRFEKFEYPEKKEDPYHKVYLGECYTEEELKACLALIDHHELDKYKRDIKERKFF